MTWARTSRSRPYGFSIARALLRRPELLLLDEVTSQLDASNETLMRQLIREISQQIPVIMVAHRLSTVVDADCVVLMQGGRVRATGSHQDLLRQDDLYREMIKQQGIDAG